MKKLNRLFALASLMVLLVGQVQGQEDVQGQEYMDEGNAEAYSEGGSVASYSALLPIGALVIAGVLIATTDRHHHGHSSSSGSHSHASGHGHH